MKDYKFQFLRKRVSGIFYSRFLATLDRIRSTELDWIKHYLLSRLIIEFNLEICKYLQNKVPFCICAVHQCSATLLKKRLWRTCFPANFVKFLRKPFLTEHLRWLLLSIRSFKMQIDFCFWHSIKTFLLIFVLSFLSSSLKEEL